MNDTIKFIISQVESELWLNGWENGISSPRVETYFFILRHQMPENEFKAFCERIRNEYNK